MKPITTTTTLVSHVIQVMTMMCLGVCVCVCVCVCVNALCVDMSVNCVGV